MNNELLKQCLEALESCTIKAVIPACECGQKYECEFDEAKVKQALAALAAAQPEQQAQAEVTEQDAYNMGANGAPKTEANRKLFEAYMRGHCWAIVAPWDEAKQDYPDMLNRMEYGVFRDALALTRADKPAPVIGVDMATGPDFTAETEMVMLPKSEYDRLVHAKPAAPEQELPNGGMHASIFVKVWGDAGGGDAGRTALAQYAYDLGRKSAMQKAAPEQDAKKVGTIAHHSVWCPATSNTGKCDCAYQTYTAMQDKKGGE